MSSPTAVPVRGGAPAHGWWFPLRGGPMLRRLVLLLALVLVGAACAVAGGTTLRSVGASVLLICLIEFVVLGAGLRSSHAVATGAARVAQPGSLAREAVLVGIGTLAVVAGGIVGSGAYADLRVEIGEILLIVGLYPLAAGLIMIIGRRQRQPLDPAAHEPVGGTLAVGASAGCSVPALAVLPVAVSGRTEIPVAAAR